MRGKYLALIHDLGESIVNGKRVVEHMALDGGFSYWWMTLLVEKSPWKSSSVADVIRLFAVEEIVLLEKPAGLRLVSANARLNEVLGDLCRTLGIEYRWERCLAKAAKPTGVRDIYRALPQRVQAIAGLVRSLSSRWALKRGEKAGWLDGDRVVFFCSFFTQFDQESSATGRHDSHFWGGLPKLLHENGYRTNWLQHYLQSGEVPDARVANELLQRLNRNRETQGFHAFLHAYLSWRVVLRVLIAWVRLGLMSLRLRRIRGAFRPAGSKFSTWPLLRGDWHATMGGPDAIGNLLVIELFDTALRNLPHQNEGLYICENQQWERAFVHAWRKYGHGRLIGVAHTTVRFWDLRNFSDARTIRSSAPYAIPRPDVVALNGKAAVDAYMSVDYPEQAIAECEALRYGHLHPAHGGHSPRRAKGDPARVLILGDYMPSSTISMLKLLEAAVPHMSVRATYTVKPHFNFVVRAADYPLLGLEVVMAPLGQILNDFDIAYASNKTSAAVDAFLAGLPVVVALDETELNMNPLRGRPGVSFVAAPEELAAALRTAEPGLAANPDGDFLFLDPDLPRWKRLLLAS